MVAQTNPAMGLEGTPSRTFFPYLYLNNYKPKPMKQTVEMRRHFAAPVVMLDDCTHAHKVGETVNQMTISGAAKCLFMVNWCFLGLGIY